MMTIAASRALKNTDVCFVGIGAPSAACNIARLTHAPDVTLIYESGTIGTAPQVLPYQLATANFAKRRSRPSRCPRCSATGCRADGSPSAFWVLPRSTASATSTPP
jgi:hypothetical protein